MVKVYEREVIRNESGQAIGERCVLCGEVIPFDPHMEGMFRMDVEVGEFWDEEMEESIYPAHASCGLERGLGLA